VINSQQPPSSQPVPSPAVAVRSQTKAPVIKYRGTKHTAVVKEVFDVARKYPETYLIRFTFENEPRVFDFHPGQFISLFAEKDGKSISRPYSIASPPHNKEYLELAIKVVEGGFMSNYLHRVPSGTKLRSIAPLGGFILLEPVENPIAFIATGTGVAPFRGMVEHIFQHGTDQEVYLFHGVRYVEDIIYREEFERLAARNPNFHYELTVSRPDETWKGEKGYVQRLVKDRIGDGRGKHAYICGLATMIEESTKLCKEMGFDFVRFEKWD